MDQLFGGKTMERHLDVQKGVMLELLQFINKYDKHITILKGGTSLMFCYGLDRFSEDIDLDSTNKNIGKLIKQFCDLHNYNFNIKKDTDTVKRFMIEFMIDEKIKVEISYRNKRLNQEKIEHINGIDVYPIDKLMGMKINAYNSRDKIRDLYDIIFIMKNYQDDIPDVLVEQLKNSFEYKGLEQFDYLIRTQDDSLIDKDKLAENLLELYDNLGLIDEFSDEIKISSEITQKCKVALSEYGNSKINEDDFSNWCTNQINENNIEINSFKNVDNIKLVEGFLENDTSCIIRLISKGMSR